MKILLNEFSRISPESVDPLVFGLLSDLRKILVSENALNLLFLTSLSGTVSSLEMKEPGELKSLLVQIVTTLNFALVQHFNDKEYFKHLLLIYQAIVRV